MNYAFRSLDYTVSQPDMSDWPMEQSMASCTTVETTRMQFCRAYLLACKKEHSCIFWRVHLTALTDGLTHGTQSSKNDYGNGDDDFRKCNKHARSDITSSVLTPGKSRYKSKKRLLPTN